MRLLTIPVAILIALACAASAAASPVFVLRGHGWGHGVGMSQYGALGRAVDGQGYKQILGFYYDGTNVGQTARRKIRVLLMDAQTSVTLRSSATFKVGDKKFAPFTDYSAVPTSDGKVRVTGKGRFASPATVTPGSGFLRIDGLRYRGDLKLFNDAGSLQVVNVVALQGYLYSVVPREMPSGWATEALKAQAVAARSYAVRASRGGHRFDIYDDTRDQVYGGLDYGSGEESSSTTAVKATAGEVVVYKGSVASTYFSSSNGGRTAASVDTWGGNLPYLVSKKDPDDLNAANPNRLWRVRLTPKGLANRLGSSRLPTDAIVTQRASGRVAAIKLIQPAWSHTFSGGPEHFRGVLGLRSSRFALGVLNIVPAQPQTVCGGRLSLDVFARNMPDVTLQSRRSLGGAWTNRTAIATNRATVVDRPCRGTTYRLHSPAGTGGNVAVRVTPQIAFRATQPAGGVALRGFVKPVRLAGETVYVSRQRADKTWHRVATTTVRDDGSWRAEFHAIEGTYRARINPAASTGLVQGTSPPFVFTLH
jgi:stage II sporulation protein D